MSVFLLLFCGKGLYVFLFVLRKVLGPIFFLQRDQNALGGWASPNQIRQMVEA